MSRRLMSLIDPDSMGCYLYTTITSQKVECNALKMAGFKVIGRFKNPSTGNWVLIHAWTKEPQPSRTRSVRGPRVVATGRVTARRTTAKRRLVRPRR